MKSHPPTRRVWLRAIATLHVLVFVIIVASQLPTTQATGGVFTVNSLGDTPDLFTGNGICADANGTCTLRAAIEETNVLGSDDTINFSVTGTINLTGPLFIHGNVAINGPGSSQLTVRRDTGGNYRVLQAGGFIQISGMTITNGRTPDGVAFQDSAEKGAGIFHTNGSLALRDVVVTGNATGNGGPSRLFLPHAGGDGGYGAGIYSEMGTLEMTDCVVSNNTTGNGGTGQGGGAGGRGAGIYFGQGTLRLTNVTITGNRTGDSGLPCCGSSGFGGGLWIGNEFFNQSLNVFMNKVTISNNSTGNNITNGNAGDGGGMFIHRGTVQIADSSISNNHTGNATSGSGGNGGGIVNNFSTLTIINSLITGNTTGNSTGNNHSTGGGIDTHNELTLINSTVSGNSTGGVTGMGGGIFTWINTKLINCTITKNATPNNNGNGVYGHTGATYTVANTIIAGNGTGANDPDLSSSIFGPPTFVSQGHNIIGNADGFSAFNQAGDQIGSAASPLNAQLGPLFDNGGPTLTHALLTNSPALDAGNNALAKDASNNPLLTDQRGAQRIADSPDADSTATVDIGAFEILQTLEDIPDKTTAEDTPITVTFGVGDGPPGVASVTASSDNQTLVPDANLSLSATGTARILQITPVANLSGTATITVTVNLTGGGSVSDTFQLTVTSVNDVPTFTKGPNQNVNEDAGPQTINNWATAISPGPNESNQLVVFEVTQNTNPALFSVAPALSPSGTLTYTPAPNAFGGAAISFVLKDDGGTPGQPTSEVQSVFINVASVNDAPTFTKGPDQTVTEDPGMQIIVNWATGVSAGPDESQFVNFVITNNTNPSLFSIQPALNNGTLTYGPAANASGTATITFFAQDNGGTANGGVDSSPSQSFTITVTAVNDAPVHNIPLNISTFQQTVVFPDLSISDADAGSDPIRVTMTVTQGTLSLGSVNGLTFSTGDGVDDVTMTFTGNLATINTCLAGTIFKPNNGFSGTATLQITSDDLGHNGPDGAKTTTTITFIVVRPVLLTEELTQHAIALDLVNLTRDPFSLTSLFNLNNDQRRRVSLFVWRLGLLPSDTPSSVSVVARDNQGRTYNLVVEALNPMVGPTDVTQVVVRLPDTVIGAPRDLNVQVTLRGVSSNQAFIKIAAP